MKKKQNAPGKFVCFCMRPCQVNCVSFIKNYKFLYNILIGLVKDLFLNFFVVKDQLLG